MESATSTTPIALARERSFGAVVRDYIVLTKPRIISLLLLTTVATMIVADRGFPPISTLLWTMLGGYLAAGGAAGARSSPAGSSPCKGWSSGSHSAPSRRFSWRSL